MLYQRILKTIKQNGLIQKGQTVIAAVSGGADSVCLLDVLYNIKDKLSFTLECAHLNHNLRGDESDGDEQYVKELCERLGIRIYTESVDVGVLSKGLGIEQAARIARYEFFEKISKDENSVIATAHTLNDNVETFFINLLRGSGTKGLCGIPQKRGNIIRPMLDIKRCEVISHLEKAGLAYRTDSTNSDTAYLRNFLRCEILPSLEKRDDIDIYTSVAKAINNLSSDNKALENMAEKVHNFDVDTLLSLGDSVLFRVLYKKLDSEFNITLEKVHFEDIKSLILKKSGRVQIRGDIFARVYKGMFEFIRLTPKCESIIKLDAGENVFNNKVILIEKTQQVYSDLTKNAINCDKIVGNIYARVPSDTDSFECIGRKCTTKLKKLLKNDGIARELRENRIVICDDEKILFVEGYGADKRVLAKLNDEKICIKILGENENAK